MIALTELGSLLVDSGDAAAALAATRQAVEQLQARGDAGLGSMFTPASAWWWHTRALQANGLHLQARKALATSYRIMLDGVANLSDEGLRRSWFNKVQAHRQLIRAWLAEGRRRAPPSARYLAHLSAHTQLREPFERLVDTGVRLNELHNAAALNEFLVEEATELTGAERVLLVLADGEQLAIAGSQLPPGEDAATLLQAVRPGSTKRATPGWPGCATARKVPSRWTSAPAWWRPWWRNASCWASCMPTSKVPSAASTMPIAICSACWPRRPRWRWPTCVPARGWRPRWPSAPRNWSSALASWR